LKKWNKKSRKSGLWVTSIVFSIQLLFFIGHFHTNAKASPSASKVRSESNSDKSITVDKKEAKRVKKIQKVREQRLKKLLRRADKMNLSFVVQAQLRNYGEATLDQEVADSALTVIEEYLDFVEPYRILAEQEKLSDFQLKWLYAMVHQVYKEGLTDFGLAAIDRYLTWAIETRGRIDSDIAYAKKMGMGWRSRARTKRYLEWVSQQYISGNLRSFIRITHTQDNNVLIEFPILIHRFEVSQLEDGRLQWNSNTMSEEQLENLENNVVASINSGAAKLGVRFVVNLYQEDPGFETFYVLMFSQDDPIWKLAGSYFELTGLGKPFTYRGGSKKTLQGAAFPPFNGAITANLSSAGRRLAHEFGHFALGNGDAYAVGGCEREGNRVSWKDNTQFFPTTWASLERRDRTSPTLINSAELSSPSWIDMQSPQNWIEEVRNQNPLEDFNAFSSLNEEYSEYEILPFLVRIGIETPQMENAIVDLWEGNVPPEFALKKYIYFFNDTKHQEEARASNFSN